MAIGPKRISTRPKDLSEKEQEIHRFVFCFFYEECLEEAVSKRWGWWSCRDCDINLKRLGKEKENETKSRSNSTTCLGKRS